MRKYYASKHLWILFVVAFTGIMILLFTLIDYGLYRRSSIKDGNDLLKVRPGQYVQVSFDEILMNNRGYPVRGTFGYFTGNYDRYVIVDNDTYIQVDLSQTGDAIRKLVEFQSGKGDAVTILAKAVWSDVMELDPALVPNANDKVMCDVVFREENKSELENKFRGRVLLAGAFVAVSFLLLFTPIGIYRVKEDDSEKKYHNMEVLLANTYHKEGELSRALKRKEELRAKQNRMKMSCFIFVLIALIGGAGFIKLYIRFEETFPIYPTVFMATVFYFGLIQAWKALLNSNWSLALPISKAFSVKSIPVQLEEISIKIGILRRLIDLSDDKSDS